MVMISMVDGSFKGSRKTHACIVKVNPRRKPVLASPSIRAGGKRSNQIPPPTAQVLNAADFWIILSFFGHFFNNFYLPRPPEISSELKTLAWQGGGGPDPTPVEEVG